MAATRTSRRAWLDRGLQVLAAGGPDAVRVEPIARDLGVTKGSFYWHFDNRDALLDEILTTWERDLVDDAIDEVERHGGDARERLRRLFSLASDEAVRVDLAVRDWARRDPAVADRLRRVDNRRMDYMRSLFRPICTDDDDVEMRCLVAFSLWIGSHFIAAEHPGRSRADIAKLVLRNLLD
jgi:Transcriptional regulator